jgi:hypothetical protein
LTFLLKSAFAEQQDSDQAACGRDQLYSEDWSRQEIQTAERENFSSKLSPINNSNMTQIVLADHGLIEDASSDDDLEDEITEEADQIYPQSDCKKPL